MLSPTTTTRRSTAFPVALKENEAYLMPQVTDCRVVANFDAKLFEQP
jgi:hypothetical protein